MIRQKRINKRLTVTVVAACLTLTPLVATAGELRADKNEFSLAEIVVTATRTEQTLKETPSTVQVITRADIERWQSHTLADALQQATGIIMFNDFQSRANLSIRGSAPRHVLIMVDGRRLSGELSYNSANVYEINRIRMENVERIEIIRGSAGALYGSDAMGGVINIITKKAKQNEGSLVYEHSFWDGQDKANQNMQFYYQGINESGSFSWSVSAGQHKPQPFQILDGKIMTTANYYGSERPIALGGRWSFGERYLQADFSRLEEKTSMDQILSMSAAMKVPQVIKNDNTRTDWSLEYGGNGDTSNWQLRTYQSKYDKDYSSYNNGGKIPYRFDLVERTLSVFEGRRSWQNGDSHYLTAGFEWRKDESEGTRIRRPGSAGKPTFYPGAANPERSDSAAIEYRALYLQDEIKPSAKWLVIPSLRYDWSDKFSSETTPRLGVTYKAQADLRFKAVIGKGYRTPTVNELYHHWEMFGARMGTAGQFFQGNPDIRPESSTDYELSIEKDWNNTTARVSIFRSNVSDLIASYWKQDEHGNGLYINPNDGTIGGNGATDQLMSYRNIDKAVIKGFETELSKQVSQAFKISAGYTYLDAKDEEKDTRLTQRAKHQLTVGIHYMPPQSAWNVSLNIVTLKDYLTNEGSALSGDLVNQSYSMVNIMAQNKVSKDLMLYLGVDNLTDHIDYNHGTVGRVYRSGVQYKF